METAGFLSEFPSVQTAEWEQAIRETVAGPDYPAKLIWHPEEGLAIKPYYRSEDLAGLGFLDAAPGEFPYVRGTGTTADWRIRECVDHADPEEANGAACAAVAAGAEEIAFTCAAIASPSDVSILLRDLNGTPVHIECPRQAAARSVIGRLVAKPHGAVVSIGADPLADLDFSAELLRIAPAQCRTFVIHCGGFEEDGAGTIEEVGFAISMATEYLDQMLERGVSIDRAAQSIAFSFAIGQEFFCNIAKLRAFRMVWAKVVESFGGASDSAKAPIHARTATWNTTIFDPHVNVLRATTETISAILGGAESISVAAFDECYKRPDEMSQRLARNTQLILKREAHLARVIDPVGGSHLIESLTNSIATKSWKLFQELESAGGFTKAKAAGNIAAVLESRRRSKQKAANHRKLVLTGTNRFANPLERAPVGIEPESGRSAPRVAESFEHLRLRAEQLDRSGKRPNILLAEIGDAKMRGARSQFAADYLACAGISAETKLFQSAAEIVACEADVLVLCSSDPEYLPIVSELMPKLSSGCNRARVVVAGNPETKDQLRALGVKEFIYLGSNAVEVLECLLAIGSEG